MTITLGSGTGAPLSDEHIATLRAGLRGELMLGDHPEYDKARRVWNGNIDRRPAMIARCAGVADVVRAVNFARTHGLEPTSSSI